MSAPIRIIMHWSAGSAANQADDVEHYHEVVTRSGARVKGIYSVADNCDLKKIRAGQYAAHTLNLNTGAIGLAMDAMRGAVERPFNAGPEPITPIQLTAFVKMVAEYARRYTISITRQTVLTHAEVQPTLKIVQRGKWDICWLPDMAAPADPVIVGDRLRAMISAVPK